jgi:hypothetical protein
MDLSEAGHKRVYLTSLDVKLSLIHEIKLTLWHFLSDIQNCRLLQCLRFANKVVKQLVGCVVVDNLMRCAVVRLLIIFCLNVQDLTSKQVFYIFFEITIVWITNSYDFPVSVDKDTKG